MAEPIIPYMTKEEIHGAIEAQIEAGQKILDSQKGSNNMNMFDVPVLFPGRTEQYEAQYVAWRKRYDEIIDAVKAAGVKIDLPKETARHEGMLLFLNRDANDTYRDITNALTRHIEELKSIEL